MVGLRKTTENDFQSQHRAYKQVGGFKAIFDIFPSTSGAGKRSGLSQLYYQLCLE
jgi:hypothetical protein